MWGGGVVLGGEGFFGGIREVCFFLGRGGWGGLGEGEGGGFFWGGLFFLCGSGGVLGVFCAEEENPYKKNVPQEPSPTRSIGAKEQRQQELKRLTRWKEEV